MSLISNVRIAGTADIAPAEVYPCAFKDIVAWQRLIHDPFIAPKGGIGADWDWPAYYVGCNTIEIAAGRQALSFQIRVEAPSGDGMPVAQAILTMPYAYPGAAKPSRVPCVFVWFIAATPQAALQHYGIPHRFATVAPMLDTAIQLSLVNGMAGRIGLHAAVGETQEESDALAARYLDHGLSRRPPGRGFFRMFARKEDGRLFYFDEVTALAYSAKLDDLR